MVKKRCLGCDTAIAGVLVFHVGKGLKPTPSQVKACEDVFEAALAFIELEGWALEGKFTLYGGQNGFVHTPQV